MENWEFLYKLHLSKPLPVEFTKEMTEYGYSYRIREFITGISFDYIRNISTGKRYTIKDDLGLIGFSSINIEDKRVIITEGISDYMTARFKYKGNVLGLTTLGGSGIARSVILSLFKRVILFADNDAMGLNQQRNHGWCAAENLASFLRKYDIEVELRLPSIGFNDITQEFFYEYKARAFTDVVQTEIF